MTTYTEQIKEFCETNSIKQKINEMKQQDSLYIKFIFTGLDLDKCQDLCNTKACSMYILYEGNMIIKCNHCDKYDKQNTTNEYEEVANMLGYNPETHPMLDYSDSYWYCKFCGEHNFFSNDCDMFRDYFNEGKIKYVNFKKSETIYIYNKEALDIQTYNFNLDNDKIILDGEEIDCLPTPSIHLFINEKLLCYVGMLLYDDGIEPVNFEDINECWKYEPLIINNF